MTVRVPPRLSGLSVRSARSTDVSRSGVNGPTRFGTLSRLHGRHSHVCVKVASFVPADASEGCAVLRGIRRWGATVLAWLELMGTTRPT